MERKGESRSLESGDIAWGEGERGGQGQALRGTYAKGGPGSQKENEIEQTVSLPAPSWL